MCRPILLDFFCRPICLLFTARKKMHRARDRSGAHPRAQAVGPVHGDDAVGAFDRLPDEMVRAILSWLDGRDLACVSITCARLCALAGDSTLWEAACRRCSRAPPVLTLAGRTIAESRVRLWFDAAVARDLSTLAPPMPEAPPPTLLLEDGTRSWKWLYVAMRRRVALLSEPPCQSLGTTLPSWWTRRLSRRTRQRVGHSLHIERVSGTTRIIIQMGALDERGHLVGFGMRAVATKALLDHRTAAAAAATDIAGDGSTRSGADNTGSAWRWTEWAWGTWRDGHVEGAARMCAASGMAHMGKFVKGLAHGIGVRVVEAGCDHDSLQHGGDKDEPARPQSAHHPHVITVSGRWRAGQPHGRLIQTTSCGDTMTAIWRRGALVTIESLLLPPRPATRDRPAFGGVRIAGMPWRVDTAGVFATVDVPFHRCLVAMPADLDALDLYLEYVRAGHPCMRATVAKAVLAAGTHFRAALVSASVAQSAAGDKGAH